MEWHGTAVPARLALREVGTGGHKGLTMRCDGWDGMCLVGYIGDYILEIIYGYMDM